MDFIANALKEKKSEVSLCSYLNKRLETRKPARSPNVIHASDITKDDPEFCPREVVLLRLLKAKRRDESFSVALNVTFGIGNAYHDLVRDTWLRDIAVGDWVCPHCGNRVYFCKEPKTACIKCGSKKWEYTELTFISNETKATGSIDLIVDLGLPKHVVVELKSLDKDQFNDLVAPKAEHRIRTSLYLRMIETSQSSHIDKIDLTHARILYVSKAFGKKDINGKFTPFKEFIVARDDSATELYVSKAKAVKLFEETGEVPAGVCPNSFCKRLKSCNVATSCFTGKYPAGMIIPLDK